MEPYLVEFNEDSIIKDKVYSSGYKVNNSEHQPIIVIIYNEYTFSANDGIRKAWTQIGETFLRLQEQGQGIMTFEFLLLFSYLNLFFLSKEKRFEVIKKIRLSVTEAVKLFEYGKANKGYWDGPKLYKQVVNKALPLVETFYPDYPLLFLFDNAISDSIYIQDALYIA